MTNKEAIITLKGIQEIATQNRPHLVEALEMAIRATMKQTVKKPIISKTRTNGTVYACECGETLRVETKAGTVMGFKCNYCRNCGQAIDWSDHD